MQLILIRHGLPIKQQGQGGEPADPPLSSAGRDQASRMARWLAGEGIDRLYASPLRRAVETAAPLSEASGLAIELEDGIAEFDRGSDVYIPMEELKRDDPDEWRRVIHEVYVNELDLESFRSRIVESLEKVIAENSGRSVAVVCHAGVINVWATHVLGLAPQLFFDPRYTSIHRFMAASSGERSLVCLNEAAHLEDRTA